MYQNKVILVVIPAYNEEAKIGEVIAALPDYVDHVLVVDDGSYDQTAQIARKNGATVLSHHVNRGVGFAFNTGIRAALQKNADITVNIDADGQFNPQDITKLIDPIISGQAEVVTASRFINKDFYPQMTKAKFWGNQFMSYMVSKMTHKKFHDVSCGFRAYSSDALLRLNLFGDFTYTQETFLNYAFKDIRIMEIPVKIIGTREVGKSKVASNLFKYGYQTLKIIIKTFRDYKPFRLFSFFSFTFFVIGFALTLFLGVHYIRSGFLTPHKWAGFMAAFMFFLSTTTLALGFILDIFARMRVNQEEMLYYLKRHNMQTEIENKR